MSRPRIRTIKPEASQDESVGRLSRDARLLFFTGLMTMADDEGRLRAKPAMVIGHTFPYDEDVTPAKLKRWLGEIEREGMILQYEHAAMPYIVIPNFRRHQRIDKPTPSQLPAPPDPAVVAENALPKPGSVAGTSATGRGELSEESANTPRVVVDRSSGLTRAPGSDRIGSEEPPPSPSSGESESGKVVTFDKRPVPTERLELAERILAEFNRQAGTGYGALTGRGRPSEDLRRILGALVDADPPLDFEEAAKMIARRLQDPFWEGRPHTGVVFGPRVFASNRESARSTRRGEPTSRELAAILNQGPTAA